MDDYKSRLRWAELKVGLVVTAGLVVVFAAVMLAGNIRSYFTPHVTVYAEFTNVKGLQPDSPVWFSGVEVGKVTTLNFKGATTIDVALSIREESFKYLKKDSQASITTLGLLGDKYVEVSPGSTGAEGLKPGDVIRGVAPMEIQDMAQASSQAFSMFTDLTQRLDRLTMMAEKGEGTISKLLRDHELYDNLKSTSARLKSITDSIEGGKGTLGLLVTNDSLYRDFAASVREIGQYAKMLREADGTLTRLMKDPGVYRQIADASTRLDALLTGLEQGKGTLGQLLKDQQAFDDLRQTLRGMNTLLADMQKNPKKYFKFSLF